MKYDGVPIVSRTYKRDSRIRSYKNISICSFDVTRSCDTALNSSSFYIHGSKIVDLRDDIEIVDENVIKYKGVQYDLVARMSFAGFDRILRLLDYAPTRKQFELIDQAYLMSLL